MDNADFLDEFKKDFYDESEILLFDGEQNLLNLDKNPNNQEEINSLFRVIHTIKGMSSTISFDRITNFTHEIEHVLSLICDEKVTLVQELLDLLFHSVDVLRKLIKSEYEDYQVPEHYDKECTKKLKQFTNSIRLQKSTINEYSNNKNDNLADDTLQSDNRNSEYSDFKYFYKIEITNIDKKNYKQNEKNLYNLFINIGISSKNLDQNNTNYLFLIATNKKANNIKEDIAGYINENLEIIVLNKSFKEDKIEDETFNVSLKSNSLEKIAEKINDNLNIYYITVQFNKNNSLKILNQLLYHNIIKSKGQVLLSIPEHYKIKKDIFISNHLILISSQYNINILKEKYLLKDIINYFNIEKIKQSNKSINLNNAQTNIKKIKKLNITENETGKVNNNLKPNKTITKNEISLPDNTKKTFINNKENIIRYALKIENKHIDEILSLVGELIVKKVALIKISNINEEVYSNFYQNIINFKSKMRRISSQIINYFETILNQIPESLLKEEQIISKDKKNQLYTNITSLIPTFDSFTNEYKKNSKQLKSISQSINTLMGLLQENVTKMRMLPISHIFHRIPLLVRDIAKSLGKKIEINFSGADTELDKNIIEDLLDPFVHIIRNAIDHGIELPTERLKKGKTEYGNLKITAEYSGNFVTIIIKDDGKGINTKAIYKKALKLKLINDKENISDREIINFIFHSGFTTNKSANVISGRGIGLDVVRKTIENLSGSIDIITKIDQGSSFIIKLPLTLAIIRVLFINISKGIYAIPIDFILETIKVSSDDFHSVNNKKAIKIRNETIFVEYLHNFFQYDDNDNLKNFYIVITEFRKKKLALAVNDLIGEQDIVVKPLRNEYTNAKGINGATILENGQVSLIIDIPSIFHCNKF